MSSIAVEMLAGDREAVAELYRQFRSRVPGMCGCVLGSRRGRIAAASRQGRSYGRITVQAAKLLASNFVGAELGGRERKRGHRAGAHGHAYILSLT